MLLGRLLQILLVYLQIFCSDKIKLASYDKPCIEHHRRLNVPVKEEVEKEIIKWFDIGVIYPIVNNNWVCSILCMPNKGCISFDAL